MINAMEGYERAKSARAAGSAGHIFDWDKAARIIKERGAKTVTAGLRGDWEWTGCTILKDGKIPDDIGCGYLFSMWAIPEMEIDGEIIECYKSEKDAPGWDAQTFWPDSARKILGVK